MFFIAYLSLLLFDSLTSKLCHYEILLSPSLLRSKFRQKHRHTRIEQFSAISSWKHQTSHILTYYIRKANAPSILYSTAFLIWSSTLLQYASGFDVFSWPPKPSLLFFSLHCHFSKLLKVGGGGGGCLLFVLKVFCFFIRYFSQAGFPKKKKKEQNKFCGQFRAILTLLTGCLQY